ncbi:hypothetical protein NPIL_12631 [Nephila pilipes]|uniref:Uncharacterized protein n=1 Tax=Nephila pilipes TaxID=299642 RepID=A0A8X6Q383_NEPPI|nr:hypothetical protein NPIL_12631 [Nephila pilipes]
MSEKAELEKKGNDRDSPDSSTVKAFLTGIQKICSSQQMNATMETKAKKHLAIQLNQILTKIAVKSSEAAVNAESLQPNHIQYALSTIMGNVLLRAATGEGARCLTLYSNGKLMLTKFYHFLL